ncbi:MAG: hypothetical protein AAF358_05260 [Pseudomonadota bacterium]
MKVWIATAALLFAGVAVADTVTPRIDTRQQIQSQRITNGVVDGSLTRAESARLAGQQRAIARTERRFERDGQVVPYERRTLTRMQNGASRSIGRQRGDRQRRAPRG